MAYDVNLSDGTRLALIPDRTLDLTSTIKLLGRNYPGYGEIMAENLVQMMEHFAKDSAPDNAIRGQVWFDAKENVLKLYDGEEWSYSGGAGNNTATAFDARPILASNGTTYNPAIRLKVAGTVVAIISVSQISYTPQDPVLAAAFPSISPGINMNVTTGADGPLSQFKLRGRAVEAEFADVAEIYESDMPLQAGDVVKIGGRKEITKETSEASFDMFGVISTAPAFLLNSINKTKDLHYPVGLTGKVPCKVVGTVNKGDRLVTSSIPGVARKVEMKDIKSSLQIIGRALQNKTTTEVGLVDIVVGVK